MVISRVFIGTATAAVVLITASAAVADTPAGEQDVPDMQYNAVYSGPCDHTDRYTFGRAPNGRQLLMVRRAAMSAGVYLEPDDAEPVPPWLVQGADGISRASKGWSAATHGTTLMRYRYLGEDRLGGLICRW